MPIALLITTIPETVFIALAVLLVLWAAATLFRPLLAAIANYIPLVGGAVAGWVSNVVNSLVGSVWSWISQSVKPLSDAITAPVQWLDAVLYALRSALGNTINYVLALPDWIIGVAIPRAVNAIYTLLNNLQSWAAQTIAQLSTELHAAIGAVQNYAQQAISGLYDWAQRSMASLSAGLTDLVQQRTQAAINLAQYAQAQALNAQAAAAQAMNAVRALADQIGGLTPSVVAADMQQAIKAAEDYAAASAQSLAASLTSDIQRVQAEADNIMQGLSSVVSQAMAAAQTAAVTARQQIEGELTQILSQARNYADTLASTLSGQIAATETLAQSATTAAQEVADALSQYREQCGDPLCEGLTPLLGTIKELQSLVEDGAFLALLAAALAYPEDTASAMADGLSGLLEQAQQFIGDLTA